ncbi:hypothetical protein MPDQ_002790 [Monascus purpureus]|uniref:Uncharacterized protein n=1 Tax=Monascus purpureus TaxID=5098 RepID=A0A507R4L0_MONPU|nr:hypothetical protein MPDQ_002790 [Monascus purpureus]BDD60187.1 hypothetical protein MAP00_005336 [Monascus purpureus]
MSLKKVYQQFLAEPKSAPLAPDVSLFYVTTATNFVQSDTVLNHLSKQARIVKKKSDKILDAVEGPDFLTLDVETTLEFISGGGAYLPSMDDNFLADHVVTFPTVHIVRFNSQNQIQQIKLYWDQGSLLKQIGVIGSRGRAWPIREATEQIRVLKSAVSAIEESQASAPSKPSSKEDNSTESTDVTSPSRRVVKDPYAAESLYELLSPTVDKEQHARQPKTQHQGHDYSELFVGNENDPSPDGVRSQRPAPRASAAKKFQPSRLFDEEEPTPSKAGRIRGDAQKYSHFEIGGDNSEREIKSIPSRPKTCHQSQWDFEDFVTPEKPKRQIRPSQIRHFAWSDDEPEDTPPAKPRVVRPRRDAETHFQLTDENDNGTPKNRRIISSYQNRGLSLYHDPLLPDENSPAPAKNENKAPLSTVASNAPRRKDFDPHWSLTDTTPEKEKVNDFENKKPVATHRLKAVQMMEPHWDTYDVSPQPKKPVPPPTRGIKNSTQRSWALNSDEEEN